MKDIKISIPSTENEQVSVPILPFRILLQQSLQKVKPNKHQASFPDNLHWGPLLEKLDLL